MKKILIAFSAVALGLAFSSCATTGTCTKGAEKACCGKCGGGEKKCCGSCGGGKCCGTCKK